MSAPYIRVPQSCPVSGRARDCLDEFNRVAADPKLGASLEQLQEGRRTMELTARPAVTLIEQDLVARLINDNQTLWNQLLQNNFCRNYMKEKPGTDQTTLTGFKWYMRQDFLYILNLCHWEAERGLKALNQASFGISMKKVASRAGYSTDLLSTCTAASPYGLGISDSVVLATSATTALQNYIALLTTTASEENWVMCLVAMIPCIQSYYEIAVDLHLTSRDPNSPWYKLWVEPNIGYKTSTTDQIRVYSHCSIRKEFH
ncbi:hypothetical protein BJ322DRAFT_1061478 [Thelephora terrestris]|uniref:Thiaminase-2/PQQC domain-containing protein n=1 Tax=Thelephora terrestris TaxID=56493 RepID=A0A9P6L676_9AGAM|nr:hypothetical protein BJ322DRAFT_1061478 [Thelephora terrestris]